MIDLGEGTEPLNPNKPQLPGPTDSPDSTFTMAAKLAGQGLTFGMMPKLVRALGTQEDENQYIDSLERARAELGPVASIGLEIAGGLPLALATGGGSGLATGAQVAKGFLPALGRFVLGAGKAAGMGALFGATQKVGETPQDKLTLGTAIEGAEEGAIGGAVGHGVGSAVGGIVRKVAALDSRAATGGKKAEIERVINQNINPQTGENKLDAMVKLAEEKRVLGGFGQGVGTTFQKSKEWKEKIGQELDKIYSNVSAEYKRNGVVGFKPEAALNYIQKFVSDVEKTGTTADKAALDKVLVEVAHRTTEIDPATGRRLKQLSLEELWQWRQNVDNQIWGLKGDKTVSTHISDGLIQLRQGIDQFIDKLFLDAERNGLTGPTTRETLARLKQEYNAAATVHSMAASGMHGEQGLMRTLGVPTVRSALGQVGTALPLGVGAYWLTKDNADPDSMLSKGIGWGTTLAATSLMGRGRSANTMMSINRNLGPHFPTLGRYVGGRLGMEASGGPQEWRYQPRSPLNNND